MKVTIIESGNYTDFTTRNFDAKWRRTGDVVNFPAHYANGIIAAGLAQAWQPEPEPEALLTDSGEPLDDELGGGEETTAVEPEPEPEALLTDSGEPLDDELGGGEETTAVEPEPEPEPPAVEPESTPAEPEVAEAVAKPRSKRTKKVAGN